MIYIDGKDIFSEWSLMPIRGGFFNQLMTYPDAKPKVIESWDEEDGDDVLNEETKLKPNDITLSFFCDSISKYDNFMLYLKSHNQVSLTVGDPINRIIKLKMTDSTKFNYSGSYSTFAVMFLEENYINRSALATFDDTFDDTFN